MKIEERVGADLMDTKVGVEKKEAAASVAHKGFDAMMKGEGEVISGWQNKLRAAIGAILPANLTAEMHKKEAAPGTAKGR